MQRHLSLLTGRALQTFLLAGVNHFQIKVSHFLAFQQYISKYMLFWRFEVCVPSTILVFEWCIILCNFDSSSCIGIWRTSFLFYFECEASIKSQSCAQLLTQHGVEGRLKQKWGMCVKHSSSFIFVPSIINILCIFSRRGWWWWEKFRVQQSTVVSTEIRDTFSAWQSKLLKIWKEFTIDAIRSSYYACCSLWQFLELQTAGIVELSTLLLLLLFGFCCIDVV